MGAIADTYPGTTIRFQITLKIDNVAQDVSADEVVWRLKAQADPDAQALVTAKADVATSGASGIAIFEVAPAATQRLGIGLFWWDIVWAIDSSTRVFVAASDTIALKERTSDAG